MSVTEQKVDVSDFWEAEHMLAETKAAVEALRDAVGKASEAFAGFAVAYEGLVMAEAGMQMAREQVQKGAVENEEG